MQAGKSPRVTTRAFSEPHRGTPEHLPDWPKPSTTAAPIGATKHYTTPSLVLVSKPARIFFQPDFPSFNNRTTASQAEPKVSRPSVNKSHSRFDPVSPLCLIVLSIIGVFFIYSAQHYQQSNDWIRQIVWIFVGLSAYAVVSYFDYKIFLKYSHWLYSLGLIALILVKLSPLGVTIYGAKRWLNVGVTTVQPSELAKLACLVIGASLLTRSEIGTIKESRLTLAKMALAISIPFLFILFQPDLGSALVIPSVVFAQLYASNLTKSFFTTAFAIFAVLVGLVLLDTHRYSEYVIAKAEAKEEQVVEGPTYWIPVLEDYQRQRIMGFIYPDRVDRRDVGWNREQSIISVGSGGLLGKGYLNGNQAQLGYLPRAVAHNDFIFSVIAEETGFLGSVVVVTLFGLLIGNSIRIATIARDRFGTLLVIGVATLFSIHVFVNIAMTIGLMPITGLPLPFLSHGGTFMVSCCVLQGLAQSVYRFRKEF